MIYETEIKIKDYIIEIEFNSDSEEFNYIIKERKKANAKSESKEKTGTQSGTQSGTNSGTNTEQSDDFEQFFK
jgi:hypothetical protein